MDKQRPRGHFAPLITHIHIHIHTGGNKSMTETKLYTLAEIATALNITTRTLLTYIKQGRLKAVKIGGKWLVSEQNYSDFINGK